MIPIDLFDGMAVPDGCGRFAKMSPSGTSLPFKHVRI
jgi:hypothetical protein